MREKDISRFLDYSSINEKDYYFLVYKPLFKHLKNCIDNYARGKVLDIGCGNKPYEKMFNNTESYFGCDIVQSSLQKVDLICEATNIPLNNNEFDTIFSTQTIEHVAEHQKLLDEAFRLLKQGGHIILSGPMYWHLHEEPYDFFRFTKYGFTHVLKKSGFEVVEILSNGGKWSFLGQAIIHTLYPDIYDYRNIKARLFRKILHLCGGISFINKFFAKLDENNYDDFNTMNYVVVGKKF